MFPVTTARWAPLVLVAALTAWPALAQDPFADLDAHWPAPSAQRTAAGYPGADYWQQRADYDIDVSLDAETLVLTGSLTFTYTNNSPDTLAFLWVHLEQNRFADKGNFPAVATTEFITRRGGISNDADLPLSELQRTQIFADNDYGKTVARVYQPDGADLDYLINGTLMKVDLPEPLAPGGQTAVSIDWSHPLVPSLPMGARSGFEQLEDGAVIVGAAQWFPRVAAYTDYHGWHVDQFFGSGEFTVEFGDYRVAITVPDSHVVAATGEIANADVVLTDTQRARLDEARTAERPVRIITTEEAAKARSAVDRGATTWVFEAKDVRDFAWASSPAFIWDAMGVTQDTEGGDAPETIMAMSFYPDEGDPLWGDYATEAVAHTLEVFTRFTFPYPYPTAQAVNGPIASGMEYPMISFNGPRPENVEVDGARTYSRSLKYRVIGIIVHETGHFYFPMVVNSDERRWMWMDEGLNTFLEAVANLTFETGFPDTLRSRNTIGRLMKRDTRPLMTHADGLVVRANAYVKVATALFVLREAVLGRETFDRAFKEYARAWAFKRPEPADFFRIMETAAGEDLDWFWRAWFYTTDHVDIAVTGLERRTISIGDPDVDQPLARAQAEAAQFYADFEARNAADGLTPRAETRPFLVDVYTENDAFTVTGKDRQDFENTLDKLAPDARQALERAAAEGAIFHLVSFENVGGVPTPMPLVFTYEDGATEEITVPAQVWRRDDDGKISKFFVRDKPIASVTFDPFNNTADLDTANNTFPPKVRDVRMGVNTGRSDPRNMMRELLQDAE